MEVCGRASQWDINISCMRIESSTVSDRNDCSDQRLRARSLKTSELCFPLLLLFVRLSRAADFRLGLVEKNSSRSLRLLRASITAPWLAIS